MPDLKESFETLEDASGLAFALTKTVAGDATTGKNGAVAFSFQDPNGKAILPSTDASGSVQTNVQSFVQGSSFSPDPLNVSSGNAPITIDASSRMETHSTVTTDEGSFRDDFNGSSISTALTGTVTFTSGSTAITGSGTSFTTQLKMGSYIKASAQANTSYTQISYVISDTQAVLSAPYAGASTASVAAVTSNWKPSASGTGAAYSVSNSILTLASGTASGATSYVIRAGDYMPYVASFYAAISQRIANQTTTIGMTNSPTAPTIGAYIQFTGTANNSLTFITQSSGAASDIQSTSVTVTGLNTASYNKYEIDISNNQAALLVNGKVVANNTLHIPGPYDNLELSATITNGAVVTNTNVTLDYVLFYNLDQVEIATSQLGEPIKASLMGISSTTGLPVDLNLDSNGNLIVTAISGFGADFRFGDITTAANTNVPVRRTAYTEQSTNARRSIASANAADAAAGTGARTVTITYYDQTGLGPFTETLTLNGTTGVNTVNTNICFIEKMVVATVGSGAANAGIITLYSAINKGGVAIGTIAVGDNQTFWSHHYVASGKTCKVTGISCGHNGTTVGSGGVFTLRALTLGVANVPDLQVSDFVRLYGQSSTFERTYPSTIPVAGPARIVLYVAPETTSSTIYRGAIDYFES